MNFRKILEFQHCGAVISIMLVGKKDSFVKVIFTHSVIIIWLEIGKNANFVNSSRIFILEIPSDFAMQLFVNEKPLLYQNAVAFEKVCKQVCKCRI